MYEGIIHVKKHAYLHNPALHSRPGVYVNSHLLTAYPANTTRTVNIWTLLQRNGCTAMPQLLYNMCIYCRADHKSTQQLLYQSVRPATSAALDVSSALALLMATAAISSAALLRAPSPTAAAASMMGRGGIGNVYGSGGRLCGGAAIAVPKWSLEWV